MWIFFKQLPRGTSVREINRITRKGYKMGLNLLGLFRKNLIKRSKIIRIKDLQTDTTEYHAIVQVESHIAADTIIENLEGKTINGLFLKPHRYYRRFSSRDRRIHQLTVTTEIERRKGERRRNHLILRILESY